VTQSIAVSHVVGVYKVHRCKSRGRRVQYCT